MRKWQAIPVAAITALFVGGALFGVARPVAHAGGPLFTLSIDCNTASPGTQSSCVFAPVPGTTSIPVDILLTNNSGSDQLVAAANFDILNPSTARMTASAPVQNASFFSGAGTNWSCASPAPTADTGAYGAGTSTSELQCVDQNSVGSNIVNGTTVRLGTITYTAVSDGVVTLFPTTVSISDINVVPVLTCDATPGAPAQPFTLSQSGGTCASADIQIGNSNATATPTLTPTVTSTPPPTATPCQANCPTPTSLAFITVTPTAGTPTAAATTAPGNPPPPPPPPPGQPTGNQPGGGQSGGGTRPITLPDTGNGTGGGMDGSAMLWMAIVALGAGGVAGGLYFGMARARSGGDGND